MDTSINFINLENYTPQAVYRLHLIAKKTRSSAWTTYNETYIC